MVLRMLAASAGPLNGFMRFPSAGGPWTRTEPAQNRSSSRRDVDQEIAPFSIAQHRGAPLPRKGLVVCGDQDRAVLAGQALEQCRRGPRAAPGRATRSARPASAAADRPRGRGRWPRAVPLRPIVRAASPPRDGRPREATRSSRARRSASAGRTPYACTGARQTFIVTLRCSNRWWNWNTSPTPRWSARSVRPSGRAAVSVTPAT